MRALLSILLFAGIAAAQVTSVPAASGSTGSSCTGVAAVGYVSTATSTGTNPTCDWEAVGGASVDAGVIANATYLSTLGGTANAITGSSTTAFPGYAAGRAVMFLAASTNTGAVTLAVQGGAAKAVTLDGSTALIGGEIVTGHMYVAAYDGTGFQVVAGLVSTCSGCAGTVGLPYGTQALTGLPANSSGFIGATSGTGQHYFLLPNVDSAANQFILYGATASGIAPGVLTTFSSTNLTDTANLVRNQGANTGSAAMTLNMSASTVANALRMPIIAGATATANGAIAYDTTNNMLHAAQSGADAMIPQFTATPVNGQCATWAVSGSNYKLASASCGSGGLSVTTKGDVQTYDTAAARLAVGTDGNVLTADSTQPTGLKWAPASAGGAVSSVNGLTGAVGIGNVNAQTGTSYTVLSSDNLKLVTFSNAAAVAVTLSQATGSFAAPFAFDVYNQGAGTVTITPTTSTINGGAATLLLYSGQGGRIYSDGTNWQFMGHLIPKMYMSFAGANAATGMTTTTNYFYQNAISSAEIGRTGRIPVTGVLKNWSVQLAVANGAGISVACFVRTGPASNTTAFSTTGASGVLSNTALTITIPAAAAVGQYSDTTHSVAVSAGDYISFACTATGGTSGSIIGSSLELW